MKINNYLSEEQISGIIEIIKNRCDRFKQMQDKYSDSDLFYMKYSIMRKRRTLTQAVISGFSPKNININDLTSKDIMYGSNNKIIQPEISNNKAVFHVYRKGGNFKTNIILENCKKYNQNNSQKNFFVIQFATTKKDELISIDAIFLNSDAEIIKRENIYKNHSLLYFKHKKIYDYRVLKMRKF